MNKRAQLAIFVLIGLVLLIAVGFISYINSQKSEFGSELIKIQDIPLEFQPLNQFIENCLEKTAHNGIFYNSLQGGYYNVNGPKIEYVFYNIPFYYFDQNYNFPEKAILENELSLYIESHLNQCFENLSSFPNYNFDYNYGNIKINSQLNKNDVSVEINLPISVQATDTSIQLSNFRAEIPSDYNKMHSIAKDYIELQKQQPNYIRTSYLTELAVEKNIKVELNEQTFNTIVFQLLGDEELYPFSNYTFIFAMKYDWNASQPQVTIEEIPDFDISIGYDFQYQVNAEGEEIKFGDNSVLFDINEETGVISFTPSYEDSGKHIAKITVEDKNGNTAEDIFVLNIENFGLKPQIKPIGYLNAKTGEKFSYTVNATSPENLKLTYLDDADLFEVNPITGLIQFIPLEAGSYTFEIKVVDQNGNFEVEQGDIIIDN